MNGAAMLALALLLATAAPAAPAQASAGDAEWISRVARSARATLVGGDDARSWAGLAAVLDARGASHAPAGDGAPATLARAFADSLASRGTVLSDIVIASAGHRGTIALHGRVEPGSITLDVDPAEPGRLVITVPGAASALPFDHFADIGVAGVKSILVLRLPGMLRLVVHLQAPYDAALALDADGAVITLAFAPGAATPWHARAVHAGEAAAGSYLRQAPRRTSNRTADAIDAAVAFVGNGARSAAGGIATASRATAGFVRGLDYPAAATTLRALPAHLGTAGSPAAALLGVSLLLLAAALALHATGRRARSAHHARNARGAYRQARRTRTRQTKSPIGAARTLVAAGADPLEVARRTRLSRDTVRLLAGLTPAAPVAS